MKSKHKQAKITLVGAGPGDPELITLKGLKAIQSADVVLYDALTNEALLAEAPESAIKVYVGKRAGQHSYKQKEINLLIVQHALQYGHVVRLKGGDPFIFGRGYEELEYADAFNLPVEVVPGISSSTSLAALQGVPVTHRGLSTGFWVLTATTEFGKFSRDLELAAKANTTVVVLMGMRKLSKITAIFKAEGKGDLPVMIVQNGSLPNEKVAVGTIETIEALAAEKEMGTPAVIVVGKVVGLKTRDLRPETLHWTQDARPATRESI